MYTYKTYSKTAQRVILQLGRVTVFVIKSDAHLNAAAACTLNLKDTLRHARAPDEGCVSSIKHYYAALLLSVCY
jgi:hypothetical protein